MTLHERSRFLSGVIEGFYGQPWTQPERMELFDWMAEWGLNTYVYAPKDDLHHRALWREPYVSPLATRLRTFCETMTELRHRPLFHALSRRTWELREKLDLLDRLASVKAGESFRLPDTYRGGMVARLQDLLVQRIRTR